MVCAPTRVDAVTAVRPAVRMNRPHSKDRRNMILCCILHLLWGASRCPGGLRLTPRGWTAARSGGILAIRADAIHEPVDLQTREEGGADPGQQARRRRKSFLLQLLHQLCSKPLERVAGGPVRIQVIGRENQENQKN